MVALTTSRSWRCVPRCVNAILVSPFPPHGIAAVFGLTLLSMKLLFLIHWAYSCMCIFVEQKQLVAQKIHIEENEDRDTGLEQRHYKEDPDCVLAKVPLGDLDLYDGTYISLESKDIM